jgi:hypothetical protein
MYASKYHAKRTEAIGEAVLLDGAAAAGGGLRLAHRGACRLVFIKFYFEKRKGRDDRLNVI